MTELSEIPISETRSNSKFKSALEGLKKRFSPTERANTIKQEIDNHLKFFKEVYGVDVDLSGKTEKDSPYVSNLTELSPKEAQKALKTLKEEVVKYPPSFVKSCDIQSLRLVRYLNINSHERYSGQENILIGGLADWDTRRMYVSTGAGSGKDLRDRFHHELYHMSDHAEAARAHGGHDIGWQNMEIEWASKFGGPSTYFRHYYEQLKWGEPDRPMGFAELFGKESEKEDRATVASLIMRDPVRAKTLSHDDQALAAKIDRVQNRFWVRSQGYMDKTYFDDLSQNKVTDNYFKERIYS